MTITGTLFPSSPESPAPGTALLPIALALLSVTLAACQASSSASGPRPGPGVGAGTASDLDGSNAAVVDWSLAAYDNFVAGEKYANPLRVARVLAMVHLAQHDALSAIRPTHAAHALNESAPDADPVAAAASAAHEVLATELPGQKAALDARLAQSLAARPDSAARQRGLALGQRAAAAVMQRRQGDGADAPVLVPLPAPEGASPRPGSYRAIPPVDFVYAPGWRHLRPFGLQRPEQFRVAPPPALDGPTYAESFAEVKRLGAKGSAARSADETAYAKFWMEFSEMGWNRIARTAAGQRQLGLQATARLFALLNVALSDAYVAGWDSKVHHDFWRPTTAIQAADTDGNPATAADPIWQSAEPTPPVHDYPSTHSALGDAAAEVLAQLLGDNTAFAFTSTTAGPGGAARRFTGFKQAADENADSRVKGGLHFRFSCQAGQALGRQVGSWVMATALRPLPSDLASR